MDLTREVSIVIPLRVDNPERAENLRFILSLLLQQTEVSVDILEADTEQRFYLSETCERLRYRFVKDDDPVFYRTRYLNILLRSAKFPIAGIWDTDVIIPPVQLREAVGRICSGCVMCFPYDGRFIFLNEAMSDRIRKDVSVLEKVDATSIGMRPSVGGAFLVNRVAYLRAGGENEAFYGWGPEDAERVKRLEILELPITRVKGPLYHLHHPRGINSGFDMGERDKRNLEALLATCGRSKAEMLRWLEQPTFPD